MQLKKGIEMGPVLGELLGRIYQPILLIDIFA
jgi:hypothetical protein